MQSVRILSEILDFVIIYYFSSDFCKKRKVDKKFQVLHNFVDSITDFTHLWILVATESDFLLPSVI